MTARRELPQIPKAAAENEALLARIEELFDAQPETPEGDELALPVGLVERFEEAAYPMDSGRSPGTDASPG